MTGRFGLICATTVVMLAGGFADTAKAQIVVITDVQYKPAVGMGKPSAEPKGTMSYPGDNKVYRVFCDYGTITSGMFTQDATVHPGGPSSVNVVARRGGTGTWVVGAAHELTNPPVGLHCRARLQTLNNDGVTWDTVAGTATYAPCP